MQWATCSGEPLQEMVQDPPVAAGGDVEAPGDVSVLVFAFATPEENIKQMAAIAARN